MRVIIKFKWVIVVVILVFIVVLSLFFLNLMELVN